MREIKYRYIVTEPAKNIKHRLYHTLEGIERLDPNHQIFKPSYEIVARDLFTGLTDMRGIEIYEGDVVRDKEGQTYTVAYDDEFAAFILVWVSNDERFETFEPMRELTVIGNIYEHPHLLEVGE